VCVEQLHLAFTFNDLDLAGFNASAFAIAVAADMGVAASQISGLTVTAGSVVVTFQLLPAGDADRFEPETLETLVATVRLPNSRAGGEEVRAQRRERFNSTQESNALLARRAGLVPRGHRAWVFGKHPPPRKQTQGSSKVGS
jgi:hypothetical protein